MIKRLALAALAALCLIVSARAQNNWTTPGGAGASGYVGMYLNAQNLAVPDSASAPHPVTCISGCAAPTAPTIAATNTGQLPVTTSSASILLGDATLSFPNLIIYNYGSSTAFVVLGGSAVTATTSGTPVAPGQQIQIPQVSTSNTNLAAITSSGTATLSIIQSSSPMQIGGGGSGGGGGGGNVNITQIQGAAPSATNPLWIQPGTGATFAVTGTFWQATQPVSNAGTFAVQAAQSGSWAVTANAGTNLNTSALATSANQTNKTQFTQLTDGTNAATTYTAYGTAPSGNVPGVNAFITNANANGAAAASSSSPVTPSNQPVGSATWAATQVSVGSTATQILAARTGVSGTGRICATIENTSTTAVYLGGSGVTTSTGMLLPGILGASDTICTTAAIYGIVATGTETVSAQEVY